jgi:hypothetical protein
MYIKNYRIEFTPKEWKVIQEILVASDELCDTANSMYKAVFAAHGRYDDNTRNYFLCPLMDRLREMGMQDIDYEVCY